MVPITECKKRFSFSVKVGSAVCMKIEEILGIFSEQAVTPLSCYREFTTRPLPEGRGAFLVLYWFRSRSSAHHEETFLKNQ